jgi:hypothetical protein
MVYNNVSRECGKRDKHIKENAKIKEILDSKKVQRKKQGKYSNLFFMEKGNDTLEQQGKDAHGQ